MVQGLGFADEGPRPRGEYKWPRGGCTACILQTLLVSEGLSDPRVGPVTGWAGTPHGEPVNARGPGVPVSATKPVPGSSAAHLRSTRRSYLQLQVQKPPHGPLSCLPRGLALPGSPPGPRSRGGNKPGAREGRELRVRDPGAEMLPPGLPTPRILDPPASQAPKPSFLPLHHPWPSFKSPLVSHTNTKAPSRAHAHTHTVPCPQTPTDGCRGTRWQMHPGSTWLHRSLQQRQTHRSSEPRKLTHPNGCKGPPAASAPGTHVC